MGQQGCRKLPKCKDLEGICASGLSAGGELGLHPLPALAEGRAQRLIPARAIDHMLERQPRLEALDLAQHVGDERARVGGGGVVRRDGDRGVAPERARRSERLARKDVERRARERTLL